MAGKSIAARQQAFRDRREAAGLERHEIYCTPDEWAFLQRQIELMNRLRRKAAKGVAKSTK